MEQNTTYSAVVETVEQQKRAPKKTLQKKVKRKGPPRYTPEEDKFIADHIAKGSFSNLQEAFEDIATKLGRTKDGIAFRYQMKIKDNHAMYFTGNAKGMMVNKKVVKRGTSPDFQPFQTIIRQMMDLPKAERIKIIKFFTEV